MLIERNVHRLMLSHLSLIFSFFLFSRLHYILNPVMNFSFEHQSEFRSHQSNEKCSLHAGQYLALHICTCTVCTFIHALMSCYNLRDFVLLISDYTVLSHSVIHNMVVGMHRL